MKKIYLAGPDVFAVDAAARFTRLKSLCRSLGLEPIAPFDENPGAALSAEAIFKANIEHIKNCDAVLANLKQFRGGCEPDSGTVFEVGFAYALSKPIAGYLYPLTPLKEQIKAKQTVYTDPHGALRSLPSQDMVEDFDLPLNLMLGCAMPLFASPQEALAYLQAKFEA